MLKKQQNGSRVTGCINQTDKNSNIITLITIMLLQLYDSILRTLALSVLSFFYTQNNV